MFKRTPRSVYRQNGQIPVDYGTQDAILRLMGMSGNVFWVHSVSGSDGGSGRSPQDPFATVGHAIDQCIADQGDIIYLMPGHAENLDAATDFVVDKAGISIIGLGNGRNRPTFTYTDTDGSVEMDAANTRLSNVRLVAGIAAVVVGVNVDAHDVILDNLEFDISATGFEFLLMIDVDAFDRTVIRNCRLLAENIAGTNTGIRLDDTVGVSIIGCELRGDFTTAAISGTAGSAAASVDTLIQDCIIENLDTTAGLVIDLHDDGTGLLAGNLCFTLFATAPETALDPGNALCCENYVVNAVDESGTIVPVTLST